MSLYCKAGRIPKRQLVCSTPQNLLANIYYIRRGVVCVTLGFKSMIHALIQTLNREGKIAYYTKFLIHICFEFVDNYWKKIFTNNLIKDFLFIHHLKTFRVYFNYDCTSLSGIFLHFFLPFR